MLTSEKNASDEGVHRLSTQMREERGSLGARMEAAEAAVRELTRDRDGLAEDKVKIVLRALFLTRFMSPREAARQMELAFDVYDVGFAGQLQLAAFGRELLALGLDVSEADVGEALAALDFDGTGHIDFDGFAEMLRAVAPCSKPSASPSTPSANTY